MSEREHELGGAGDAPAPESADSKAGETPFSPRPFRGWVSAQSEEQKPSIVSRVAALFKGRGAENNATGDNAAENHASGNNASDVGPPVLHDTTAFDDAAVDEAFSSVEDALPAPTGSTSALPLIPVDEPAAEARPGILSRIFRRSKSTPRPSLEIEIHEDRIAAAADALDDVGDQAFAADRAAPQASPDRFASVEEALPDDDFASSLEFVQDFEARLVAKTDDSSLDSILGSTQELAPPPPKMERESEDAPSYFGDTLDPDVFGAPAADLDGDTDEFEIAGASLDQPPPPPPADEDTAKISRKSLIENLLFWRAKSKLEAGPGSTVVEAPAAFLFSKFRTFYNEIIRFKHQKTEFTAGFSTAIVADYSADLSPEGAADALSKKLVAMLELQAAEAMWMGGESAERYPDAQYAMAALADETFLYSDWDGQAAWHKYFVETKLFRTRAAEVELFRRIDKLLKDQPDSAAARDLARVYLFVIAAGFRGKYRPFGLTRVLAEYRQRLFEYIHHGSDALMIYAPQRRIFPEAAERTLVGEAVSRYTGAQRWAVILAFLVVGYTAIAHFAWSRVSADLKDVTDRIEASNTANGSP